MLSPAFIMILSGPTWPYTNIAVTRGKVAAYEKSSALTNRVPSNGEAVNDVKSMVGIL
jgi:hypothetical protein